MYHLIIIIAIIVILTIVLHQKSKSIAVQVDNKKHLNNYEEFDLGNSISESEIPKIIWTYWDECPPAFIMGCIKSWIDKSPDHKVIVLTDKNYTKYIDALPESNILNTQQRKSDMIRVNILASYGGIWMDATIICTESLSWVHTIQKNTGVEYVGYHLSNFTSNDKFPVIENWFMACKPKSIMMKDILNELNQIVVTNSRMSEYVQSVIKMGVDLQKINEGMYEYLWMHVAIQKLLQSNPEGKYKYHTIDASTSAYMYLKQNNWKIGEAVNQLAEGKFKQPIIKLRSGERKYLLDNEKLTNKLFQQFGIYDYQRTASSEKCQIENDDKEIILSIDE
jgi:hypothetical protein